MFLATYRMYYNTITMKILLLLKYLHNIHTMYQELFDPSNNCIMGFLGGSDIKESACNAGDPGSVPRLGRAPGEQNGNPFQYSCQETLWTEEPSGLQSTGSQRVRDN